MTKQITIVRTEEMNEVALFAAMQAVTPQRLGQVKKAIKEIAQEREDYEAKRERIIDGILQVGQSPDIKHVQALVDNEAFTRLVIALNINPRSYLHPASQKEGKSSSETSNLKAYRKARQIAEVIWSGVSDLENVAKVFTVCAYHFAKSGHEVLTREYCENFLTSHELRNLDQGTQELWNAIDEVRAKQMTKGGASTQSGQMVRTLVALGSATDVREGRSKHVRVNPEGMVMQALVKRFGQ